MKKIFSILSAGLVALAAISCVQEKMTVFDPTQATAPVLASYEVTDDGITATYNPGSFGQSFNTKMPVNHSLVLVSVNGAAANKMVSATFKDGSVSASAANISKALMALGCAEETYASFDMIIRASMQEVSKDNGLNGHVDSDGKISVSDFYVKIPEVKGNPWKDYTESSPWSLIGSIASTGNSWNKDEPGYMVVDGNKHVVMKITLGPDDQFKFRKDGGWDTNFGAPGDTEPFVMTVGEAIEATPGGKNLAVPAQGQYDILLDEDAGTITIYEAFQTYPGFDEISNWTVIGAIASFDMSWNKDVQMTTDGEWHVAEGVVLSKDDQFKFRMDLGWDTNIGAAGDVEPFVVALDEEYIGAGGGKNLAVAADGTYDLLCNPSTNAFKIVESLGGKSPLVGDEPEPEPEPTYKGWGIIGDFNSWGADAPMTEKDGVWTGFFTNIAKEDGSVGGFKFRKDADWAENLGAVGDDDLVMVTLGEPVAAVANGKNLGVAAGFYKVVLDLSKEDAATITVSEGEMWSLIGDFNGWGADVDMELTDGKWVSPATKLNTKGFKIRHNHDWTLSVGGTFAELGVPFEAVSENGPNIVLAEDGEYIVTYDPEAKTITIDAALPSNTWSLIGVNGDWNNDIFMTEVMPGIWMSPEVEITTAGWKLRFNHDWTVNCGTDELTEEGKFVKGVQDGKNIDLTGKFKVVYNANNGTIGTLVWGVVGSIASIEGFNWNNDVPMNKASDGKWYSVPVKLTPDDQIKIRQYAAWVVDRGGECKAADEAFAVTQGGANIKAPKEGTYMLVYDPENETITLSTDFWSLIGDFNSWGGDKFMLFDGAKWVAFGQNFTGGWKIRHAADWTLSVGGTFVALGEPFAAVSENGPNIKVEQEAAYDIVYDTTAQTITVK